MIDVEDLVNYFVEDGKIVKSRGVRNSNIQITCPKPHLKLNKYTGKLEVHYETNPSLGIMVEPPYLFSCFGCGFKGTIEFLVAELLGIDLLEAVRWLSNRYEFEEGQYRKLVNIQKIKEYEELFQKRLQVKEFPESYFQPFRQIHRYTLDRGFTQEIARKYEIGFDKWQRRIVMPIRTEEGRIVGLYGRAIDEDNEAKYMYYNYTEDMQIEGFDKGLFTIRNKTEERKNIALIVESGLDVPWADQHGLTEMVDVISILGSKISPTQANSLGGYKELIMGFDNDYAGERGMELFTKVMGGVTKLSVIEYPKGTKDLGECNSEQMKEAVRNRKSLLERKVSRLQLKFD